MKFRFKNFRVYQDAKACRKFCREVIANNAVMRDKNLTGKLDRSLNSVVLTIAEGSAGNSDVEFSRFLCISMRSIYEAAAGFDFVTLYEYETFEKPGDFQNSTLLNINNKARNIMLQAKG
ncbi:MAG: four helix bundle protein [Thermodesulfobacteriota bacterium]